MNSLSGLLKLISLVVTTAAVFYTTSVWSANAIETENTNTGTADWELSNPSTDVESQIKGYASEMSVDSGETLQFFVSVNPTQDYSIQIYRMGYYQGLGGRLMWHEEVVDGDTQPPCPIDATTGLTYCPWISEVSVTIPPDWLTGIYLAKLTNAQGFENYIPFTVRNGQRKTDLVYQQPVTTYHAYNNYSTVVDTAKSSYDSNSTGASTIVGSPRAVRLSFDRPYENTGAYLYFLYEHELVMYLEEMGYDLSYITDVDTHNYPDYLSGIKGFISAGHDEYWTREKFDTVENARDQGVHLAFMGANAAYWQIRLLPDGPRPNRIMEIYKNFSIDPEPDPSLKTILFRNAGRAEQQLVGVQYVDYGYTATPRDFFVQNADHWIYTGLDIDEGDKIIGVIGGEIDKRFDSFPLPVSDSYTVLGQSPYQGASNVLEYAQTTVYQAPSGAWVFASGTLLWHRGLTDPSLRNPTSRRITRNLLNRFVLPTPQLSPTLTLSVDTVTEQAGEMRVVFDLSSANDVPVYFNAATVVGTAEQGLDYYGAYEQLSISVGETQLEWPITILDDTVVESNEYFSVRVWGVQNADVVQAQLPVSIIDNDSTIVPSLRIRDTAVNESEGEARVLITLSQASARITTVEFSTTTGGDANQGLDYYGTQQTAVFMPGETRFSVPIAVLNDSLEEDVEQIRVQIYRPTNAIVTRRYGTIHLVSDDKPTASQ